MSPPFAMALDLIRLRIERRRIERTERITVFIPHSEGNLECIR